MQKGKRFLLLVGCSLVMLTYYACNSKVTSTEFIKEVSQNENFVKKEVVGEYILSCNYRPSELICLSEMSKGSKAFTFDKQLFDSEMKKYSNVYYIDFSIAMQSGNNVVLEGVRNTQDYAARIAGVTYLMTESFYMLQGHDTIKAINCVFSNTYGNSPNANFMFMFPKKKVDLTKSVNVVYDDKVFGIPQKVSFSYDIEELTKKLPEIIE